jgi:integrase
MASIVETAPGSGVWRIRVLCGYRDGDRTKPIQKRSTHHGTRRSAQKVATQLEAGAQAGQLSTSADSVAVFLTQWVETAAAGWKLGTARRCRKEIADLVELFGPSKRLRDLKPSDVASVFAQLTRRGLAPASLSRYHATLHGALEAAVEDGDLARNPADHLKLPKPTRREPRPATADEIGAVIAELQALRGGRGAVYADFVTLAASTALRDGEVAGLQWRDVGKDGRLTVRHSVENTLLAEVGASWRLSDTKSHQERTIGPLPAVALAALERRWNAARGTQRQPGSFVFTSSRRGDVPVSPHGMSERFTKCARRAGVEVSLKSLRSFAITQIADATSLAEAAAWAGHSSTEITSKHYAGRQSGGSARAAAALDTALAGQAQLTA